MKLKLIIAMVAAVCMVSAFSTPAKALDYFEFPAYTFPSMVDRDDINVQLSMCDKELHKWCTENTMNNADKKACFDVVKPTCVEWILQGQPASPSVADLQHHATLCNNAQFTSGLITFNEVVASVSIDFKVDENNALKLHICTMNATYDELELNWIEEYKQFTINLGDIRALLVIDKGVAGMQPRYAFLDANLNTIQAFDWIEFSNILVAMGINSQDIVFIYKDPNLPPIGIDINKTIASLGKYPIEVARMIGANIFSVMGMTSELLIKALIENNVVYIQTPEDPVPRLMNAGEALVYAPLFLENVLWHRDEDVVLPPLNDCSCGMKGRNGETLTFFPCDRQPGEICDDPNTAVIELCNDCQSEPVNVDYLCVNAYGDCPYVPPPPDVCVCENDPTLKIKCPPLGEPDYDCDDKNTANIEICACNMQCGGMGCGGGGACTLCEFYCADGLGNKVDCSLYDPCGFDKTVTCVEKGIKPIGCTDTSTCPVEQRCPQCQSSECTSIECLCDGGLIDCGPNAPGYMCTDICATAWSPGDCTLPKGLVECPAP